MRRLIPTLLLLVVFSAAALAGDSTARLRRLRFHQTITAMRC